MMVLSLMVSAVAPFMVGVTFAKYLEIKSPKVLRCVSETLIN